MALGEGGVGWGVGVRVGVGVGVGEACEEMAAPWRAVCTALLAGSDARHGRC